MALGLALKYRISLRMLAKDTNALAYFCTVNSGEKSFFYVSDRTMIEYLGMDEVTDQVTFL